jgi:hypothetical protein
MVGPLRGDRDLIRSLRWTPMIKFWCLDKKEERDQRYTYTYMSSLSLAI